MSERHSAIDYSHTVSPVHAVAMGSSITVGLGVFILVGLFLQIAGEQTPLAYLAAILVFLPLVLTCAEKAAIIGGSGGAYSLIRAHGPLWRTFASGWLLLGGHLVLIALLGWGAAIYLNTSLNRLLDVSIDVQWLAPGMVMLVVLNDFMGTRGGWHVRIWVMYASMVLLLLLAVWSWFLPTTVPTSVSPLTQPVTTINVIGLIALMPAMLWGMTFILDSRDEIQSPGRTLVTTLITVVILGGTLGALVASAEMRFDGFVPEGMSPLTILTYVTEEPVLEAVTISIGLLVSLIGLDRAMITMTRLIGAMVRDGFLPEWYITTPSDLHTPPLALRVFALIGALTAVLVQPLLLVSLTSLALLWVMVLLNLPDTLSQRSRLPAERPIKLPFHPLFPGLATAISIFLPLALGPESLLLGLLWLFLGGLYYFFQAQKGAMNVRKRSSVVGDTATIQRASCPTILVGIANPTTATALIRLGARIAHHRQGRVLVLRVIPFFDQVPQHLQRLSAEEQWHKLHRQITEADVHGVRVEPVVRLAHQASEGIVSTIQEEDVMAVILGWEGQANQGRVDLDPVLDPVIRHAACDVLIVRGDVSRSVSRIMVPITCHPGSIARIKLAYDLTTEDMHHVIALHMVQERLTPSGQEEAKTRLRELVYGPEGVPSVELRLETTSDIKQGLIQTSHEVDMMLIGASRGGMLDRVIFGGLPVDVARSAACPVMLVKNYEGHQRFWLRRIWETVSSPFPVLSISERAAVYRQMGRAARPSVDFFILIVLSSMIAMLGLLQSSPAVIIGAMLVAPLMSPIIAIAMGIVQGNGRLLRIATGATLVGIVLAVSTAIASTILSPSRDITTEILARTRPTVIDLLVALASGAAGGYAIARKEVAAALPGVAIAAALVPPLTVVGYGTATGQLQVAGGSLLLFATNLVAIIFAAAVVFFLLGFRPNRARQRKQVRIGFIASVLSLVLISIPLGLLSMNALGQIAQQNRVEAIIRATLESETAKVTDLIIERHDEGFIVHATIYATSDATASQRDDLEQQLNRVVGLPVALRATVLRAILLPDRGDVLLPTPDLNEP
ncbi:MAG: DUF389 domain-containing protein [Chloroflexaceae bacterium]|nr:DUF389 domain-containing protein [Chloroflexaceae bacterium]